MVVKEVLFYGISVRVSVCVYIRLCLSYTNKKNNNVMNYDETY